MIGGKINTTTATKQNTCWDGLSRLKDPVSRSFIALEKAPGMPSNGEMIASKWRRNAVFGALRRFERSIWSQFELSPSPCWSRP
jgi:hypothetical protein